MSATISLRQARDRYPNNLREARLQAPMTRAQLVQRCEDIATQSNGKHVSVSLGAIKFLEAGVRRPRLRTALTLAAALTTTVQSLFPNGLDNPDHVTRD